MSFDQEYPYDIIFEILSRTTLDALDKSKVISKGWKKLIYESSFISTHLKRRDNVFGYFIEEIKSHKFISTFVSMDKQGRDKIDHCITRGWPHNNMKILASCNQGILCCQRRVCKNYRYYIGKPASQQWKALPNPKLRYRTIAIAIVVFKLKPLHYKIIRLSKPKIVGCMMEHLCETFDSNTWGWRATKGINLPYNELIIDQPAITVGEFIYWQTYDDNMLAFNADREDSIIFSLPGPACNNDFYTYKRLVEYEGGLGFICLIEDKEMELWIWARRKNEWERKMVINISDLGKTFKYPRPIGFYSNDIVVMKAAFEVIFYKLEDGRFTKVDVDYDFGCCRKIFQFRSDVDNINIKGGM